VRELRNKIGNFIVNIKEEYLNLEKEKCQSNFKNKDHEF
jgi:hypothetical protein